MLYCLFLTYICIVILFKNRESLFFVHNHNLKILLIGKYISLLEIILIHFIHINSPSKKCKPDNKALWSAETFFIKFNLRLYNQYQARCWSTVWLSTRHHLHKEELLLLIKDLWLLISTNLPFTNYFEKPLFLGNIFEWRLFFFQSRLFNFFTFQCPLFSVIFFNVAFFVVQYGFSCFCISCTKNG
jgi:hypothetical protein